MQKLKIFISSVQREFSKERNKLFKHFVTDPLLSGFFDPVMFEKFPASERAPDKVYLDEVENSHVYLILIGQDYGFEDENGISPTEHEYNHAKNLNKDRLAFVKDISGFVQHKKETKLFKKIQNQLTYKQFENIEELLNEVTKSCITLLKRKGLIQLSEFDESLNIKASIHDINKEKINTFIGVARSKRGFPLREGTPIKKVLAHLNMIYDSQVTNSALLAFSVKPEKYFPSAIVKCAHFHGLHVEKPIPDHKVISGDIFTQVDEAIDFVLSKISVSVGLRDKTNQAPLKYEIPRAVVAEAIVNAVAHRDYNSNGSVQVMLFINRLEISNPGGLTPELSLEKLKIDHASYPTNPLLAEPLYQAGYIERFGTGTGEIYRLTAEAGLEEPKFDLNEGFKVIIWRPRYEQFSTGQATGQVTGQAIGQANLEVSEGIKRVVLVVFGEIKRSEIQNALELSHRETFMENYLNPTIANGFLEMTLPDKPTSPKQKYRLTKKGLALQKKIMNKDE